MYENGYSESQTDYYRREVGTLPKSISLKIPEQLENEANDLFDEINRGLDKVVIDEAVEDVELLDEIEELLGIKKDAPTQEPKSEPVDSTEKKVFTKSFRIRNYVRK